MLAILLLCSPLLLVEAVVLSTAHPSDLLLPAGVVLAANALLLGPVLWRGIGPRLAARLGPAALSSSARWSSWTGTVRRRHAGSVR